MAETENNLIVSRRVRATYEPPIEASLGDKTVAELEALAAERGATVAGTGKDGRVLKSDLVTALGG